jgi:hypothetical protein
VKIVVIAVVVAGVSVAGLIRGIFVTFSNDDPGMKLDLNEHPKFRQVLDDVAERIHTRAVDSVYLTPETDIAVMERTTSDKREERCLILGVGVLDGFKLQSFKAVLGHEYGHLVNRDTAGGDVAIAVRSRIFKTARHIAEGGAAAWYNPAWLFLRGFDALFLKISQGASRFQEVMADRWAAFAYGSDHFEDGLRHAIASSVEFDVYTNARLKDVVEKQQPLANLYERTATEDGDAQMLVSEALDRETTPYDSHPSFRDRVAWVRALNAPGTEPVTGEAEAWSLFHDPETLQRRMTNVVRDNIRMNCGVEIPEAVEAVVA